MWKTLADWLLTLLNMSRELQENRASIREIERQVSESEQHTRNLEEAVKLLAQEMRHTREMESAEREKLLLKLERELVKLKELPASRLRVDHTFGSALPQRPVRAIAVEKCASYFANFT